MADEPSRILPGLKPVIEALETIPKKIDQVLLRKGFENRDTRYIQSLCQQNGIKLSRIDPLVLDKLCRRKADLPPAAHQGVAARLSAIEVVDLNVLVAALESVPLPLILALDQIQDPGNLGTLARTLYTLGGCGLLVPLHNTAALSIAAERSAAGALEKLPVCRVANLAHALDDLEEMGLTIYGSTLDKTNSLDAFTTEFNFPAVLVLGNEAKGLRPGVAKRCQFNIYIPQARVFDSLNVAQAGAILLGVAWAQRRKSLAQNC
ncbi:MAG: RNA methyltransferase [Desulfovibrionaceae bacterium]|nr:RNA methyltransferase [Desulfovibrionaceae bacterium]